MRETISVADVRKICEVLVKEHGDVFETSIKCNQPVDLIKKIKNKKFMKAISDSYFTADTWGAAAPGVEEPEPIKLTDVNKTTTTDKTESTNKTTTADKTPSTNKTNVTTKQAHQRTEPLTPTEINEISKMIAEGISVDDIAKTLKIGRTSIGAVRNKSRYSSISDKYFKIVGLNIISLKTNEVVGSIRGPRDKKTTDKKTNEKKTETKKTKPTTKTSQPKITSTESTTALVSEIRRLGVQLLMSMKITDLPEHIRVEIEKIIENEIDNMSLSEIASLGESK
jgi:hypothetical protein